MATKTEDAVSEDFSTAQPVRSEAETPRAVQKLRRAAGSGRRPMATRERVAFMPRIDPQANATWSWYLRPDGFRPVDAIVFKPAASATDREDYERKGFVLLSQTTGELGRGTLEMGPPARATCEEVANELNARRPDYLDALQQEINENTELAESGKPDWRRTYLMKVRQLEAIQSRCRDLVITGSMLDAFFTTVHAHQVANRVPDSFRRMQQAAAEEAQWNQLARDKAIDLVE